MRVWSVGVLAVVLWSLSVTSLAEGWSLFSRYHRDVSVQRVELLERRVLGKLEDGRFYLTERDAIEMALANNLGINVQRHAVLVSDWAIRQRESYYDPQGTFGFNWDRQTNPSASVLQGGTSVTDILTTYNLGYQQPFKWGTSIDATFMGNRNRSTNFFSSLIPAIRTEAQIIIRQDLLRGFGKAAAEYDIEISRNNLDISAEEFRQQATDTIVQVQNNFWELEFALNDLEVRKKSLEYAQTVLEQNQARFEVGTASRLEVVEAEAEVASRREELIRAQYTYRRVQDALVRLISDFEDPQTFTGELVPVATGEELVRETRPFEDLLSIAGEMRPELQKADLNIANLEVNLEKSRDQLRPGLQALAGYQWFGLGGTRIDRDYSQGFFNAPVLAVVPGGIGDSLAQLLSGDYGGYVVGLSLQLPIKNSAAQAMNAEAQINLRRGEMEKRTLRQQVALEIRDALTQVQMNEARLEASQAAVEASSERLQGEEARFEVGMGTTRQLIEAQRDLLQTKSTEVRARTDLIKSLALLDQAVGRTFDRKGIVLDDALDLNVVEP